jgi:hypothetical protein
MASFVVDIDSFVKKAKINPAKATKKAFFEVANRIVFLTPVDNGRLVNNWFAGVNHPDRSTTSALSTSGAASKSSIDKVQKARTGGDFTLYLNNSLPYAHRIEFDGWSHTKAPAGMVRVAIAEFNHQLMKAARGLNK